MLITDLIICKFFLFLPLYQVILDLLMVFWLEILDFFQLIQILEMHSGFISEPLDVFKNKVIRNRYRLHNCIQHGILPIVRRHNCFQILRLRLFWELILAAINNVQNVNIRTYFLVVPADSDHTSANNIFENRS